MPEANSQKAAEQALVDMAGSELLISPEQVGDILDRMASEITSSLEDRNPVLLAMMLGGVYPAVWLSQRLRFPHQFTYLHATRYRGALQGGDLEWKVAPPDTIRDQTVLLIDDILDRGHTLDATRRACLDKGAHEVLTAVLVRKCHEPPQVRIDADFVGLEVPNRYVFGCGMDVREYWRQLGGIYALAGGEEGA